MMQLKKHIDHWLTDFRMITQCFSEDKLLIDETSVVDQLLHQKNQDNLVFCQELIKHLKISKKTTQQMTHASHLFLTQYKIMNRK